MTQCDSEVRRLQAINKQKKEFERKQQIIRDALKEVDKKPNKKITFDFVDEEPEPKKRKKDKKTVLFDSDDEDVELTGHEFDIKPQLSGELIKLQSKYGNDDRFILDERFADKGSTDADKNDNQEEEEENGEVDEKAFNFKVLENVLGKQIITKPKDTDKKSEKKFKPMVRYDPEDESHTKYEIKPALVEPKKKKEKKAKLLEEEKNEPPPVSNDIFYSVSENLAESLKKEEEFSLLKMFGRHVEEDDKKIDNSKSESIAIEKKGKYQFDAKNPFKYDSSDDEDEEISDFVKKDDKIYILPTENNFFFSEGDPRLFILKKEEFLQPEKEEEINFKARRSELKRIVKKKINNIQRDCGKWKSNKSWKDNEKRKKH